MGFCGPGGGKNGQRSPEFPLRIREILPWREDRRPD